VISRLPIRVRVTAAFAVAMALVLAGSGLFLYLRLASHLATAVDDELRVRAEDLRTLVESGRSSLTGDVDARLVEQGESYAEVLTADGRVVDATPPIGRTPLLSRDEVRAAQAKPLFAGRAAVPGLDERSRLLATSVRADGRRLVLVVGATLQDRAETLAGFRTELVIAGPIALILASGAGYLLAGVSLRQVERMRRRASAISAERPGTRLPVPPTGDELELLGETLNQMLERLEGALQRERTFVADAAHELRTPLASLRAELELALRQAATPQELRDAVGRSSLEVERLSQLAEDLLVIARSEDGGLALRLEDLSIADVFAFVVARFSWRAAELGKTVRAQQTELRVRGDRLRLEQALGNLVDNGLRHGGRSVELDADVVDGEVELHVRDDGRGFPAAFLDQAFERFTRPDSARGSGGSGLGLAIVRTIAEAHGGTAQAANRPDATDVWLTLRRRGS
jgi:two-component system OmpR family sensor kinase